MTIKINSIKASKQDFERLKKDIANGVAKIKKTTIYKNIVNFIVEA